MTLSVDPSRLVTLQSTLQLWLSKRTCTLKQLQSLVGQLMFVLKCVRQSRIFVSRILDLLRKVKAPRHHLRLNSEFRKDLHWWRRFLPLYNGVSLIPTSRWPTPDTVFSTDGCLSGCGVFCPRHIFMPRSRLVFCSAAMQFISWNYLLSMRSRASLGLSLVWTAHSGFL